MPVQEMEAFHELPPGRQFLGVSHPQAHFETVFWMGDVSDNGTYEPWTAEGALWEQVRATRKVQKLIAAYGSPVMDAAIRESLDDFITRRSREIMGESA